MITSLFKGMFFICVMLFYSLTVWKAVNDYFRKEFNVYIEDELKHLKSASPPAPANTKNTHRTLPPPPEPSIKNYIDEEVTKLIVNDDGKFKINLPNNNIHKTDATENDDELINAMNEKSPTMVTATASERMMKNGKGHENSIRDTKSIQEPLNVEIIYEAQRIHQHVHVLQPGTNGDDDNAGVGGVCDGGGGGDGRSVCNVDYVRDTDDTIVGGIQNENDGKSTHITVCNKQTQFNCIQAPKLMRHNKVMVDTMQQALIQKDSAESKNRYCSASSHLSCP